MWRKKMQYTLSEIYKPAQHLVELLSKQDTFLFSAEMGSGKTTLISTICELLEVDENISSPTYAIVNEYFSKKLNKKIAHIDLYRLKNDDELQSSGVLDYIQDPKCICFIEWPLLVVNYLTNYIQVEINTINETTREISFSRLPA